MCHVFFSRPPTWSHGSMDHEFLGDHHSHGKFMVNQGIPDTNPMNRRIVSDTKSGDSWMYPYQRTPMGNPYISPIYPYIGGVYGLLSPRIPNIPI